MNTEDYELVIAEKDRRIYNLSMLLDAERKANIALKIELAKIV